MDTDFHATSDISGASTAEPVSIGAGAKIGERVTILKGSRIGKNARIAADSVVAGDIPDDVDAGGVPARFIPTGAVAMPADLGDLAQAIAAIVARTFRVAEVSLDDGPTTIRGWDSLGALRLLVAIEDAYRIVLPENTLARSSDVRALASVVAERIASGRE
jgi:acyl carrier protein